MAKAKRAKSVTSRINGPAVELSAAERFARRPKVKSLIRRIAVSTNDRSAKIIEAAEGLRGLREAFDANRSNLGMTWYEWVRKFGGIPDKNVAALLMRIANAKTVEEKEAILRVYWRDLNDRQKSSRANKRMRIVRMSKARRKLIEWAEDATEAQIEKVWSQVGLLSDST